MTNSKQDSFSDDQIQKMALFLNKKFSEEQKDKTYATVKEVLTYIGMGATIAGMFLAPKGAGLIGAHVQKNKDKQRQHHWKKKNAGYLRQTIRRLEKQKLIEHIQENGKDMMRVTTKGKKKILRFGLDSLVINKSKPWDGKWRVVIYDIANDKRSEQLIIRKTLKRLEFYSLQESVYILPYPCYEEIEFLRSYYSLGESIKYLLATQLEDDYAYKEYFGLTE